MSLADESDHARVVYYGDIGSGKTTAAAHLAHLGKVAYFESEPSLKKVSLKNRGVPIENIMPIRNVTCELMMDSFWKLKAKLDDNPNAYAGGVLDTLTNFVNKEIAAIRKREYEAAVAAADARGEEYEGPRRNKFGNTWDLYGELTADVRDVIESYVMLPMHLAWTAHVRRDEDADNGDVSYGPAANPAVAQDVVAYFDCVIRTERIGNFFVGHTVTSEDGKWKAKDRLDVLPAPIMNAPTMDRIVAYVNGDLTEKTDPIQKEWVTSQKGK